MKVSRLLVNVHHFSCARRLLSEMNDINLLFYINNRGIRIYTHSRGRDGTGCLVPFGKDRRVQCAIKM